MRHVYNIHPAIEKDRVFVISVHEYQALLYRTSQHPLQGPEGHTTAWISTTNVSMVTKEPGLEEACIGVSGVGVAFPQGRSEESSTLVDG